MPTWPESPLSVWVISSPPGAVLGTTDAFAAIEDGGAVRADTYHGNPA
ncbi:MAG: hypothetical protein ACRD19_17625 [Terriglobia bacterium]